MIDAGSSPPRSACKSGLEQRKTNRTAARQTGAGNEQKFRRRPGDRLALNLGLVVDALDGDECLLEATTQDHILLELST